MPKNTEKVRFYFRGEKIAKCIGTLAHNIPKQDQEIEGVLGNGQKMTSRLMSYALKMGYF